MKPFKDIDLGRTLDNQRRALEEKVNLFSNEEILANSIELLASNLYEEFYIEPVTILEEEFPKRSIKQGKIKRLANLFFRASYGSDEYVEVDGIIMKFYFPFTGEADLFKCQASTNSLSP